MNDDVEIEYLPTMGSPESIKTLKQGRTHGLKDQKEAIDYVYSSKTSSHKPRFSRQTTILEHKVNAKRIINFKFASEKQKAVARQVLEGIETGNIVPGKLAVLSRLMVSIVRTLSFRFKDFKLESQSGIH